MKQVHGMSADKNQIILNRIDFKNSSFDGIYEKEPDQKEILSALVVDVETTGLDRDHDEIIEIGLVEVQMEKRTGIIKSLGREYRALQETGIPLKEVVIRKTGLTNEILKGNRIDWSIVNEMFETTDLVIAFHAYFDRGFCDRYVPISKHKLWGCALHQIDWYGKGHPSRSLENLIRDHGAFTDCHQALDDVKATVWLLGSIDPSTEKTYFKELLSTIKKKTIWAKMRGDTYSIKEDLKECGYIWRQDKVWKKKIFEDEVENEKKLAQAYQVKVEFVPIRYTDNFKEG